MRKVKLAWSTQTAVFLVPHVGLQAGIFQKHNIDPELIYTRDGPTAIAALVGGDTQFAELADPSVTTSALAGSGVEWAAVSVPKPNLALFTHPDIASVEALKGKSLGVTSLGSLTSLFAEVVLRQHGLDPKTDVHVIAVGGGLEAQAAILNNRVDAIITAPDTPLPGQKILVDLRTGYDFPQGGLVITKAFAGKDPQLVQDMVAAFAESVQRFKTDRTLSEQIITKEFNRTDPNAVHSEYDGAVAALSSDVMPTTAQMKTVLDMLAPGNPKAKDADPAGFFDARFATAAKQTGS